jgi:hypothetical protein
MDVRICVKSLIITRRTVSKRNVSYLKAFFGLVPWDLSLLADGYRKPLHFRTLTRKLPRGKTMPNAAVVEDTK